MDFQPPSAPRSTRGKGPSFNFPPATAVPATIVTPALPHFVASRSHSNDSKLKDDSIMSDDDVDKDHLASGLGLRDDLRLTIPTTPFLRVSSKTLIGWIDERKSGSICIVDVRCGDFEGGHIPSAIHVPYTMFEQKVGQLVEKFGHVDQMVFHCMYSRERGPACATRFLDFWNKLPMESRPKRCPNVFILDGGYFAWFNHCMGVGQGSIRIADYEADSWISDTKENCYVYKQKASATTGFP